MTQATRMRRGTAFGGFDMLESRVSRFAYSPHRHAELVIAAYLGGHKQARCGRERFEIAPGDVLVIGPETLHEGETGAGPGWHYLSVYLSPAQVAAATGAAPAAVETAVAGHRLHRRPGLARRLRDALSGPLAEPLALSELLIELVAPPATAAPPVRLAAGLARVRDRLADDPGAETTLAELAALAGLSPEHLSRQFRAACGLSPFQFLTAARTRHARDRIAAGAPLAEAALAAGFADQSHLNRWFKRIYGVTPGAYAASRAGPHQARSRPA